jgi:putative hydrolase of the HAD superfamily
LGQVIIDLDPNAVIEAFSVHTNGRGQDLRDLISGSDLLIDYETGKMEDSEFVQIVNSLLNTSISEQHFASSWNLMIGQIPMERLNFMERLMKTHKVLILSNTNHFHEIHFDAMLQKQTGRIMSDYVHTAYYSHDIGFRKPDTAIYSHVIEKEELVPGRSLFLDDRPENIASARKVGLLAEQVRFPDQIFEIITNE